jgi:thiol-disulfide isomerase/thioredoxin
MKKFLVISILFIFLLPLGVSADSGVVINFFFSPTCPHCADEARFLDELEQEYGDSITVKRFDLVERKNIDLVQAFYTKYQVSREEYGATPATFIEKDADLGRYFIGYGEAMNEPIKGYLNNLI